jgi:hypothetical protein
LVVFIIITVVCLFVLLINASSISSIVEKL